MNWQDYLAFRVLDLQKQLATEKRKVRNVTRSRDMWRSRYEQARDTSRRHRAALACVNYRERKKAARA